MDRADELNRAVPAAREVARRLHDSADELRTLLPLTGTTLAHMPEKFRTEADAMLHRFRTLYGLLTLRILPPVLALRGYALPDLSEAGAVLAAAGLLSDAGQFARLTGLRDRLRDAFPVDPAEEAEMVNACARAIPALNDLFEAAILDVTGRDI